MFFRTLLLRNIKKDKKLFFEFAFCFILGSIALSINPYITSRIIGCFENSSKNLVLENVIFWLIIFLIFKILQAVNQYFLRVVKTAFETKLNSNIVSDLFEIVHKHNIRYFDDEMTGRISSAITKSSGIMQMMFTNLLFELFRPLINFIFAFFIIGYACPKLAFSLALICIPFFFALRIMGRRISNFWRTRGTAEREYLGFTVDSITNYKLVRYTGSIFREKLNAYKILKKYLRTTYSCETQRASFETISNMLETTFIISSYFIILYFAVHKNVSLADAFFAFSSIQMLNTSLSDFGDFSRSFFENYGELQSNIDLINKPIEIKDKENAYSLNIKKAAIKFSHVNFSYIKEKPIFTDLNLTIPAGQKVGLVGLSGAGKSTLISLLIRSYLPQTGSVTINKHNIADITELSLHKNIAYVPQDVTLFNRSLYENLKIANPKADKKEIIKAAKLAYIHNTITALDNGYDAVVGERGILLSGGERQRIAIARAILQNAPILILDEATSALDSEAEIMVQNALENLMKNKTVIAIAHRLSTLRSMDRIIVLDHGKIIEDGNPKELLKKENGLFNKLYNLQTDGYLQATEENK